MKFRTHPKVKSPRYIESKIGRDVLGIFLYFLNIYLAYMLMLVAMTYNVELFWSMMTGIIVGYTCTLFVKEGMLFFRRNQHKNRSITCVVLIVSKTL